MSANEIRIELQLGATATKVPTHPASRIDELLPHRWGPIS
jgi:hypothetical protein